MNEEPRISRRRHRVVAGSPPPDAPALRDDIHVESDANDRVRHWELPQNAHRTPSRNVLISLGFLAIIAAAGYMVWYMLKAMPPPAAAPTLQTTTESLPSVTPKIVDALPNERAPATSGASAKPDVPVAKIVSRLQAPDAQGKWALAEFPSTGDLVELDPSGLTAYARNFTEACVRPPVGAKVEIGVRGREAGAAVRSFVGDGEACATVFDEPFLEIKLPSGELRGVQFGLQQGAPYVAVRRISAATVALTPISR
jgi:hypothetical protein